MSEGGDRPLSIEELAVRLHHPETLEGEAAYLEVLTRFEPLFRRVWFRSLQGRSDVEYQDFVHSVLVRLMGAIGQLKNPRAFPGYLRRVVLSAAADLVRRSVPSVELDQVVEAVDAEIEEGLIVQSYLEHLPGREAEAVRLGAVEGLSAAQAAEVLGITSAGFRKIKSRGLNKLRDFLRTEYGPTARTRRNRRRALERGAVLDDE